jgi:hypothetical protein
MVGLNQQLLSDLQTFAKDPITFDKVFADFSKTFERLGASALEARVFSLYVLSSILRAGSMEEAEQYIKAFFETEKIQGKTIFEMIIQGLQERFEIIFLQVHPYLIGITGKVIDYGFRSPQVTVPVKIFDGFFVPVEDNYYTCAVLTNVIHHEKENEKVLQELSRIVSQKLVIIETVPEADDAETAKKDWGRMILNDTLWNRFFNYADIPVPGTYETPSDWIQRLEKYGWKCTHSEDLGFDQPTIQDRHHLLVFEK